MRTHAWHLMVWIMPSFDPVAQDHGITHFYLSTLTIKCLFVGLSTHPNSLHIGHIITSESGIHEFPICCTFSVSLVGGTLLSATMIEHPSGSKHITLWHKYRETTSFWCLYWLSELWVKDMQTPLPARHARWMGEGSGQWATVSGPSRVQEESVCATA